MQSWIKNPKLFMPRQPAFARPSTGTPRPHGLEQLSDLSLDGRTSGRFSDSRLPQIPRSGPPSVRPYGNPHMPAVFRLRVPPESCKCEHKQVFSRSATSVLAFAKRIHHLLCLFDFYVPHRKPIAKPLADHLGHALVIVARRPYNAAARLESNVSVGHDSFRLLAAIQLFVNLRDWRLRRGAMAEIYSVAQCEPLAAAVVAASRR